MENLAEQLRKEKASSFDLIKGELTEKVMSVLKQENVMSDKINFKSFLAHDKISENKAYGNHDWWEISTDFKYACREHFLSLGFIVTDWYSRGGHWWGYNIEI